MLKQNKTNSNWLPFWFFGAIAMGVLIGFTLTNIKGARVINPVSGYSDIDEVLEYVRNRYVDPVDIDSLQEDAIIETLQDLDPHSVFFKKEEIQRDNEQIDGEYDGIGVEFYILNDTVTIARAFNGGPSESIGIRAGDKIISVNDSIIAGKKLVNQDVVRLLKGKSGTKVNVGIKRGHQKELIDFRITRAPIPLHSIDVAYMIDPDTGFIKIDNFSKETYREFKIELNKLSKEGMQNLIIDLRGNPGGIMIDALQILDEFLTDDALLLTIEGEHYPKKEYVAEFEGNFENGKIVVLINENSASASEILAGALQDWDRGLIVGRRSFGKGLVQHEYGLQDGSAIRLTVARYYTPSGRSIQRPYEKGSEEYYTQYYSRNEELFHKDSIKVDSSKLYYTLVNHRKVYGGGGIIPDLFVPLDSLLINDFVTDAYGLGLIQDFTLDYYAENENKLSGFQNFNDFNNQYFISPDLYNQFVRTVEKTSDKTYPAKETKDARDQITKAMKALIARQLFGEEGYQRVYNEDDTMIKEALEALHSNEYEQLLSE